MNNLNQEERLRLGIILKFSSNWMGGIIYITNIIKVLNFLDDNEKPQITLFYKENLKSFVQGIEYPYFNAIEWSFPSILSGFVNSILFRRNLFIDKILKNHSLDVLFPIHDFPVRTKSNVKLISWWADLQHKYYPDFFSRTQIWSRNFRARSILRNCDYLILSSRAVLDDFARFYPIRKGMNISIFHFVSVINNLKNNGFDDLKIKYHLPEKYFIVSNQFHKHKNHKVVLLAISKLKSVGIKKHVAFTGQLPIASDSPYLTELSRIIDDNKLYDQITLLGLIPRSDQLALMRHCQAVIQPSLFEGWSTVIEDAKSLQVPVVASNLTVNIEQLGVRGLYFNPYDPDELANIIKDYPERNLSDCFYDRYELRIKNAAKQFLEILS